MAQIIVVTASASSYDGGREPLYTIDGIEDPSNGWWSALDALLPQSITLDLGFSYNLNQIVTHLWDGDDYLPVEERRMYTYYIEASIDGTTWVTVVAEKLGQSVVTDIFGLIPARYVKITVTGNTANTGAHIEEVTIFGEQITPPPTSGMFNGLWLQAGYPSQDQINKYKASNFSFLCLQVGKQLTDGSIVELPIPGEISAFITVMRQNGFKIYAWIQSNSVSPLDMSPAMRPNAVAQLVNIMQKYGFDGLNTNVEAFSPWNHQYFHDFLNEVTDAMHAIGKTHVTSMVVGDGEIFKNQGLLSSIRLDYLSPMMYDGADYWTQATFNYWWDFYMNNSPCPVLPGIIAWDYDGRALSLKLNWINELLSIRSYPLLSGFKVFWNATLQPQDWIDWIAWPVKDGAPPTTFYLTVNTNPITGADIIID